MKALQKLTSFMVIGCILCALSLSAFAAPAESARSTYAGQDKSVKLVMLAPDGTATRELEFTVAIPENATVNEEIQLTNAAARAHSGIAPMTRSGAYAGDDLLSHYGFATIASAGAAMRVGGGTLQHNYDIIYVELHGVRTFNGATRFNVRIESSKNNNIYTNDRLGGEFSYLYMLDGTNYGSGKLVLDKGDSLNIWMSTVTGYMEVSDIYVSCSETY